ncbi:ABC transporter permease [Streptosporangium saharense]|uniref:ABC transporter permease n=1 Tax=Streptosporangium saharense TaxID=1706840 RepID=UPI003317CF58
MTTSAIGDVERTGRPDGSAAGPYGKNGRGVRFRPPLAACLAVLVWAVAAALTLLLPDRQDVPYTSALGVVAALVAGTVLVLALVAPRFARVAERVRHWGPWLAASGYWFVFWEVSTAKTDRLSVPYFTSPQGLWEAMWNDHELLVSSFLNSLRLLVTGFTLGAVAGVLTGISMAWWRRTDYWVHPILMSLGPVPATAWLPLILVIFPSTYSGSVFMMTIAVWFPVTVLTRSGIAGVGRAYYDVAQTLGAGSGYLVWRVAVPAALPQIFVGLFMGLGSSFITLVVAEMLGVKDGLGWYIQWTKGWAAYPRMYGAIVLMIVLCAGAMTVLFKLRSRALRWQKDLVRW